VDAAVAEAAPQVCDLGDPGGQFPVQLAGRRRVAVRVTGEPHKTTGAPLGQIVLLDHLPDGGALGLWG
jgi:hypothetical protein